MAELDVFLLCRVAAMATLLAVPGACARPVGDLGRADASVIDDVVMPAVGSVRAHIAREPISSFNKTDAETEMANRVWHFMTSGRTHDWFFDAVAELRRTRILPGSGKRFGVDRYSNWLQSTPYGSSTVRYASISDDIETDLLLLPDLFTSICRVDAVDRERSAAAANLPDIGAGSRAQVVARAAENTAQIDWFVNALRYRFDSYNYALDHLVVETPDPEARGVDRDLGELGDQVAVAERGAFCKTGPQRAVAHDRMAPAIPSRFSTPVPPPPPGRATIGPATAS